MIRHLLIVLMFALPAQFAWAAAAGYCAHESDPVSFHIGHHAHEHRAGSSDADPGADTRGSVAQGHADCSYCHALVAQFATARPSALGPPPRDAPVSSRTASLGTGLQDDIDRPKWTQPA